jgi:predicted MPP superfamily phosphohydrolase
MTNQTVRVLHASDLHFGQTGNKVGIIEWWAAVRGGANLFPLPTLISSHSDDCVNALADFAFANEAYYDVLLLTGDLATTGSRADLRRAYGFLTAARTRGYMSGPRRPTLHGLKRPIQVLPGNHDRYGDLAYPGNSRFDGNSRHPYFSGYWKVGQRAQLLWLEPNTQWLALIGVDFTLAKNDLGEAVGPHKLIPGYLGQGRVYRGRLQDLIRITASVRQTNPDCAVVWVLHFEPASADDSLQLLDPAGRFAQAIQGNNVAAILCGHTHDSASKKFGGTGVWTCGTTTQHRIRFDNHLHYVQFAFNPKSPHRPTIQVTKFSYLYDPGKQRMGFVANGTV